jgi:hypothetical protein
MRIVLRALLVLLFRPVWASEPGQPLDCSDWVLLGPGVSWELFVPDCDEAEPFELAWCVGNPAPTGPSGADLQVWQLRPRGVTFRVLVDSSQLRFFELTELDTVFSVFINEAEAIASFSQSSSWWW